MARKKKQEPAEQQVPLAAPEAEVQTPAKVEKNGVSKTDAVKQALATLGKKAKPKEIQTYIKDTFGLEMSTGYVSNLKTTLGKKGKGKRGSPRKAAPLNGKPAAKKAKPKAKAGVPKSMGTAGIALEDIQTVKDLLGRLGAKSLQNLISLVEK